MKLATKPNRRTDARISVAPTITARRAVASQQRRRTRRGRPRPARRRSGSQASWSCSRSEGARCRAPRRRSWVSRLYRAPPESAVRLPMRTPWLRDDDGGRGHPGHEVTSHPLPSVLHQPLEQGQPGGHARQLDRGETGRIVLIGAIRPIRRGSSGMGRAPADARRSRPREWTSLAFCTPTTAASIGPRCRNGSAAPRRHSRRWYAGEPVWRGHRLLGIAPHSRTSHDSGPGSTGSGPGVGAALMADRRPLSFDRTGEPRSRR